MRSALVLVSAVATAGAAESGERPFEYSRHDPEATVLHRVMREHFEEFLRYTREHYRKPLPRYVEREFRRYLDCGILRLGLTRLRCGRCGKDMLVAFSCKTRGICPSCAGRRMAQAGVHLTDKVLPDAPVRQWVVSFPYELRALFAANASVLSAVIRIVMRAVLGWYRQRGRELGCNTPQAGAVSVLQRFGGSLNLNCHIHAIVVDGVHSCDDDSSGATSFRFVRTPTGEDIASVARSICERVCKMLGRRGLLREPRCESNEAPAVEAAIDGCRGAALGRGRFERIDEHGASQQELFAADEVQVDRRKNSPWAAEVQGFSVHAGVSFGALDRKGREKLARYCLRPGLALERLSILRDGSIAYRLKQARRRGGATHRVLQPLELMARLAAIVPPPRVPLLRYHGCLGPAARRRARIAPSRDSVASAKQRCLHAGAELAKTGAERERESVSASSPNQNSNSPKNDVSATAAGVPSAPSPEPSPTKLARRSTSYVDWATLMARTFGLDVLQCGRCSGRLEPIAVITKTEIVERIVSHLRLPLAPEQLSDGHSVGYDVTEEPMPAWAIGTDPDPEEDARGPPPEWDCVDPPAPED